MQDFVGVCVADARNESPAGKYALHLATEGFQPELKISERQRVVDHVGALIFEPDDFAALTGRKIVDLPHFLLVEVSQVHARLHLEDKYRRCCDPGRRIAPHQPAGQHRTNDDLPVPRQADYQQLPLPFERLDAPVRNIGTELSSRSVSRPDHIAQYQRFSFYGTFNDITDNARQQVFPDYDKIRGFRHETPNFNRDLLEKVSQLL